MRVFFNEDNTHYLYTAEKDAITAEDLKQFIYGYKDTSITDFVMCLNGTVSTAPSEILETLAHKYLATEENGFAVDYKDTPARLAYALSEEGIDMYAVWIEACREIGLNPWISFRMNDAHGGMLKTSICKGAHVEMHPEEWLAAHRTPYEYFDKNSDYSKASVRKRMLSYIEEQIEKYDVFGVELDFSREPYCFPCGMEEEGKSIIATFVEEVRNLLDTVGKKRKKQIKLGILGQANPMSALKCGFDFVEIAERVSLDFFVASPRWETVNTDIPIALWKRLLPKGTEFGCSQGLLVGSTRKRRRIADVATDMGLAAANAHRGCDFLYLYNHFETKEPGLSIFSHENDFRTHENIRYIYENIGCVENFEKWERRVPITYDDFTALTEKVSPRLPSVGALHQFLIPCGRIDTEREIRIHLVLETAHEPSDLMLYVNAKPARLLPERRDAIVFAEGEVYTFAIALKTEHGVGIELQTVSQKSVTVQYVDVLIPPVA